MTDSGLNETVRAHMIEKIGWAERSVTRMRESNRAPCEFQDHFWAFLHASRLIWFYFGRWLDCNGAKGQAGEMLDYWKERHLRASDRRAWDAVTSLRTADVHVKPVPVTPRESKAIGIRGGKILVCAGKVVAVSTLTHRVEHDGESLDCLRLATRSLELLTQFAARFDQLPAEHATAGRREP